MRVGDHLVTWVALHDARPAAGQHPAGAIACRYGRSLTVNPLGTVTGLAGAGVEILFSSISPKCGMTTLFSSRR
jgi:hypothetical protein